MSKQDSIVKGVEEAWDCYLNQHDVSVPNLIEDAVEKAVTKWLKTREGDIIEAIARHMAEKSRGETEAP